MKLEQNNRLGTQPPTDPSAFSQESTEGVPTPTPFSFDNAVVVPAINLDSDTSDGEFGINGETTTCDKAGI